MMSSAGSSSKYAVGPTEIPGRPGFSRWTILDTIFDVEDRYILKKSVGIGAYGIVVAAYDTKKDRMVAIKKIPNAFSDPTDALRILREIRLMHFFRHANILQLTDLGPFESFENFNDVYIISDLMETDLHRIITSKQELTESHYQYFVYQMLLAIKYMHSANVIHRDLKPGNMLLNADCTLKICDLGLARGVSANNTVGDVEQLTEYVVTRWYRAPEIMLACKEYTKAIDVWSIGCILGELLGKKPLMPGNDYIHQLKLIIELVGYPTDEEDVAFVSNEKARSFLEKLQKTKPTPLNVLFPTASPEALDLLSKMLQFNPKKRITVDEALVHPFFRDMYSPDDIIICSEPFDFALEKMTLDKLTLQRLMKHYIQVYHPDKLI